MNKKISQHLTRASAILAALSITAAGALMPAGDAQARDMKIATIAASNSPWDHAMRAFADEAAKQSGNDLQVHVYTDGQLGDISKILSSMQLAPWTWATSAWAPSCSCAAPSR